MPIEVNCTECSTRLEVPDEAAGAEAKCPYCLTVFAVSVDGVAGKAVGDAGTSTVLDVTVGAEASGARSVDASSDIASSEDETSLLSAELPTDEGAPESGPVDQSASSSPESTVATDSAADKPVPPRNALVKRDAQQSARRRRASDVQHGDGPLLPLAFTPPEYLEHGCLDAAVALRLGWSLFLLHMPLLLATHALVLTMGLMTASLRMELVEANDQDMAWLVFVVGTAAQWFLNLGLVRICLAGARKGEPQFGMLLSAGPLFVRFLLATILYLLLIVVGLMAFIFPGIYLAARFWPYHYFLIDTGCGPVESLRMAGRHSGGNMNQLVSLWSIMVVLALGGVLLFFVGLIFALPLISMIGCVAYLMLTRQPIVAPVFPNQTTA